MKSVVVLDRLQDPGNVGTIVRTADAAGFAGIITVKGTADIYSPKVVRSAAGSIFRIPILQAEDAADASGCAERSDCLSRRRDLIWTLYTLT